MKLRSIFSPQKSEFNGNSKISVKTLFNEEILAVNLSNIEELDEMWKNNEQEHKK